MEQINQYPRVAVKWYTHGSMTNKDAWTYDAEVMWNGQWLLGTFKTREEAQKCADTFVLNMIRLMNNAGQQCIKGLKKAEE